MKLASSKKCTGCMACVDVCAHRVLEATVDSNGYYTIVPNAEKLCVECGRCSQVCPVLSTPQESAIGGDSSAYAAWNLDSEQRKQSASGGIFAALATAILHKGGIVYGAAIEGFTVKHLRVTQENELQRLQGSKYQHSDLTGVYRQVRSDLQQGRDVLFSGLACQVAGLLSFLGNIPKERLYTVDTICGGLSTMLPMQHLQASGKYKGILSFRDKANGWQSRGFRYSLKMICKDGSIADLGLRNMVLDTFSSKLLKRSSCLDCQFVGLHRLSDCTIGDFWGDDTFKEQHREGLSLLMIHNNRLWSLIKEAGIETKAVTWANAVAENRNIYWTHYPFIRHLYSRKKALHALRRKDYLNSAAQNFVKRLSV